MALTTPAGLPRKVAFIVRRRHNLLERPIIRSSREGRALDAGSWTDVIAIAVALLALSGMTRWLGCSPPGIALDRGSIG